MTLLVFDCWKCLQGWAVADVHGISTTQRQGFVAHVLSDERSEHVHILAKLGICTATDLA